MRLQQNSTQSTAVLAPEQTEIIAALARGETVTAAVRAANVSRATYYLWVKDPSFLAELNRVRKERADAIRAQLVELADTAIETIRTTLSEPSVPAGVKLKASLAVLQSIGSLTPEPIGSTDPRKVETDLFFMDRFSQLP